MAKSKKSPLGSQKSIKQKANDTEKKLARDLGAKQLPASGALDGLKGDVTTEDFLLDSKETGAKSILVSGRDLTKISKEAREVGKKPALVLKLGTTTLGTARQWVCIPLRDFTELLDDTD